eukprot:gnl/Spiro4/4935_TR2459_c0_g1_i1.p1 gnl/Spiro4/4935_TR2459_c0_g1~~gnl/Spiro4/4935_TR2459_c0_g1_i1.p1  ORF type:complete len:556 (-),score=201.80 gnl/Spiro4/4935_TR2459_c0_g1_i1:17-1645(-)
MLSPKLWFFISLFAVSLASNCLHGPCGPGNDQCGAPFDRSSPQFHVRDLSCAENDPNFPFYDPLHGLYHLFYQNHLCETQGGDGQGPVIGHAVSPDMVKWSHLPVALWNDEPYDTVAVWTGSATIVEGVPTLVYPGLCSPSKWPNCQTGTLFAVAVPADHKGDPLLTAWTKPAHNPIVNNTQRDPSTAWQTARGEWRLTNYEGKVYYSSDFVKWDVASAGAALWAEAECPDFFPLPAACRGCTKEAAPPTEPQPTHVHKESSSGQDWYTLGVYADGAAGSTGSWTVVGPALRPLDGSAVLSTDMAFYASKGFYDPVGRRQIYYGWALVPPASVQTLPRVVEYHPQLQQLLFNPLPELSALRALPSLFSAASVRVPAGGAVWLGDWAGGDGNQSEFRATFALPVGAGARVSFGVAVAVGGSAKATATNTSLPITIWYDPATPLLLNVSLGVALNVSQLPMAQVPLLPGETSVDVVAFLDNTILEVFVLGGRLALTRAVTTMPADAGMALFADGAAVSASDVDVWHLDGIWVSPSDVLAKRRRQ